MPNIFPPINDPNSPLATSTAAVQAALGKVQTDTPQPYDYSAHSVLGNVGHVLGRVGNIAGDILDPRVTPLIPGTDEYKERRLSEDQGELDKASQRQQMAQSESDRVANETANRTAEQPLRDSEVAKNNAEADASQHPTWQHVETDQGIFALNPKTNELMPLTYNGQPLKKAVTTPPVREGHVPVLGDDGKPTLANYDSSKGTYTDTQGNPINHPRPIPPPPSYGQLMLPTKTATLLDPNTDVPTIMQWNPKTQTYDKPVGQSATGPYGHEEAQAGAVTRAGNDLINTLEANKADLGTLGAWVKVHGLNTPIADPRIAAIQSQLRSFAALNPAMHGARGAQAIKHFEQVIGGAQQNPDATISTIRSIIGTAGNINPGLSPAGGPPAGAKIIDFTQLGKK